MATKKTTKAPDIQPATEITVEVPRGSKRPTVEKLIQAALREVQTTVLESDELMIVRLNHDGGPLTTK